MGRHTCTACALVSHCTVRHGPVDHDRLVYAGALAQDKSAELDFLGEQAQRAGFEADGFKLQLGDGDPAADFGNARVFLATVDVNPALATLPDPNGFSMVRTS